MQCFFSKLVQMSNFDRLNSANEHIWIDYFQTLANPYNPSDVYGGYYLEAPFRKKYLLSNTVLFL